MCKNFLVFLLTFCLGLTAWQFIFEVVVDENVCKAKVTFKNTQLQENVPSQIELSNLSKTINPRFGFAGVNSDQEVKDLYLKFQKAVAENDKETVATLLNYPLKVNFPNDKPTAQYTFVKNRKSFINLYDKIFDGRFKRFIAKIDVEKDDEENIWAKSDGIAVGRGVIWLGVYCSKKYCVDNKYYIKFRTFHADSNLMDVD